MNHILVFSVTKVLRYLNIKIVLQFYLKLFNYLSTLVKFIKIIYSLQHYHFAARSLLILHL